MAFRYFLWSLRNQDWKPVAAIGFSISVITYSVYDYKRTYYPAKYIASSKDDDKFEQLSFSQTKPTKQYLPSTKNDSQNHGRYGQSFPETKQYKKQQINELSIDEIELQLKQRENRYNKFMVKTK